MEGYIELYQKRDYWLKAFCLEKGYNIVDTLQPGLDFYYLSKCGDQYSYLDDKMVMTLNECRYPYYILNHDSLFQNENNILTTIGLMKVLIDLRCIYFKNTLILGYGDLSKKISHLLSLFHHQITIANRNEKEKEEIISLGFQHCNLKNCQGDYDLIINTIPVSTICYLNFMESVIVDLATFIEIKHDRYYSYLSLPNDVLPRESGLLLFKTIDRVIQNVKK